MQATVFLQLLLPGFTTGCVYALVALGFVLCANVSGVVNFAQGEFVMLGGMAAAYLIGLDVPGSRSWSQRCSVPSPARHRKS